MLYTIHLNFYRYFCDLIGEPITGISAIRVDAPWESKFLDINSDTEDTPGIESNQDNIGEQA